MPCSRVNSVPSRSRTTGRVSSVKVVKAPAEISGDLQRAFESFRYKPYLKDGAAIPVCIMMQSRVVVKHAD